MLRKGQGSGEERREEERNINIIWRNPLMKIRKLSSGGFKNYNKHFIYVCTYMCVCVCVSVCIQVSKSNLKTN